MRDEDPAVKTWRDAMRRPTEGDEPADKSERE